MSAPDARGGTIPPPTGAETAIQAARAALVAHDPIHLVLEAQAQLAGEIRSLRTDLAAPPLQTLTLTTEQLTPLTCTLEAAAERGVRRYADSIVSWRSLLTGGVGIAGLLVGIVATYVVMAWEAAATMDAARIEVPAVFGTLPAAEAAAWARLMRDNPPIGRLLAQAQPITTETRGKAVSLAVWIDPPKPAAGK